MRHPSRGRPGFGSSDGALNGEALRWGGVTNCGNQRQHQRQTGRGASMWATTQATTLGLCRSAPRVEPHSRGWRRYRSIPQFLSVASRTLSLWLAGGCLYLQAADLMRYTHGFTGQWARSSIELRDTALYCVHDALCRLLIAVRRRVVRMAAGLVVGIQDTASLASPASCPCTWSLVASLRPSTGVCSSARMGCLPRPLAPASGSAEINGIRKPQTALRSAHVMI